VHFKILITDNITGNHPADKWAEITAERIAERISIEEKSTSPVAIQARKDKKEFVFKLERLLTDHHQAVQDHEIGKLIDYGHERLRHSIDPYDHVMPIIDQALADILEAAKVNGAFHAYYSQPEELEHIKRDMLRHDFASSMHIERSAHCDRHADHPHVKAWREACRKHGVEHAHHNVGFYLQQAGEDPGEPST
jgi:hypothetical protein